MTAQSAEGVGPLTTLQQGRVKVHAAVCFKRRSSHTSGEVKLATTIRVCAMTVQHAHTVSQKVKIGDPTLLISDALQPES